MNRWKKVLACALAALLCLPMSLTTVSAAETNGTYEAENAKIEGVYQTLDWTTFQTVDVDPVESTPAASGGKNVGFFSTVGNSITWTVPADAAGTADLTFVLASCLYQYSADYSSATHGELPLQDHLAITVNGKDLDVSGKVVPADATATQATYDYYQDVTFSSVALNAGDNQITISVTGTGTNPMATESANVDCLKVTNFTAGAAAETGDAEAEAPVETPEENTPAASATLGEATVYEAEDADLSQAVSAMEGSDIVEAHESASGGKNVGYFGVTGNKVIWAVEHAGGDATVVFVLASGAFDWTTFGNADMVLDGKVKLTVNGAELAYSDVELPAGNYENWQEIPFDVTLNAGSNEIVLEIVDASAVPNIDCIKVYDGHVAALIGAEDTTDAPAGDAAGTTDSSTTAPSTGTTDDVTENDDSTPVATPVVAPVQKEYKKETAELIRDIVIGALIGLVVAAAGYGIYVLAVTNDAARELIAAAKARKAEWKKSYAEIKDPEEQEIARVKFELAEKAIKADRLAQIDAMNYKDGVVSMKAEKAVALRSCGLVKYMLPLMVVAAIIGGIIGAKYVSAENRMEYAATPVNGSYNLIVNGFDWGPAVTKVVLALDGEVKEAHLERAKFDVEVTSVSWFGEATDKREVTGMYLSDESGNQVEGKSQYIALEFIYGPDVNIGSPFTYDFMTGRNSWSDPYDYNISLASGSELVVDGTIYTAGLINKMNKRICPEADVFEMYNKEYEGITLHYASYAPEELKKDKVKNALIIWLHGAGEGGSDAYIDVLGNRVTGLIEDEVQQHFDGNGAYVLAPQSPTMWMDNGTGAYTMDASSMYTESLKALIDDYVASNDDIDPNRIIVGGCSNGGYMTMNMILTYPDFFAAAYPVCEAYADANITDAMLAEIVDLPIWFTHAAADTTVTPTGFTVDTYERLVEAGAQNVHFSFYDKVVDKSGLYTTAAGAPYEYMGHYSWIYTLNNDCTLDYDGNPVTLDGKEVTIWEWLAAQSK